ncbi:SRPBCC family protein [Micromonospora sp. NPDC050187]|uniref:SRPBCC family protein n=1 Tax=Micromonospora sp. NPDC050187 TaxID=3364277 RepID=UPI00378C014C
MNRLPVGRLFRTDAGSDLVLTRTFRAPVEDVWASVTEPERTARWFGPWEGEPGPGRTVRVQLAYEEGKPWHDLLIEACEPPHRLAVATLAEHGSWRLEMLLVEADGVTELRFVHHLDSEEAIGEVGPGWEYYLDLLVAARDGADLPIFDDYYPAMKPYYDGLPS